MTSASEAARRILDAGEPVPPVQGTERLALAWALKEACYAAWSSAPQRAAQAADALAALADGSPEIDALADWTAGIAHVTRGQMAESVGAFDRAGEGFRRLGQPGVAAQTQVPKIMALAMLGRHREAADCATRTQQAFVALGDWHAASKVSLNLGSLHLRHDEYAEAARHYREAAVLFARAGDREHSVMADIGLADTLAAQGDTDEATRIYARARMRAEAHGFPVLLAMVDESSALLALAQGRYREALAGFESSRRRYETLAMPQHLAIAEKQLADAYLELRMLPEALALLDEAAARFVSLAMPDDEAQALAQRGRAEALLGERAKAEASLARAAELFAAQGHAVGESAVALARAELLLTHDPPAALASAVRAAEGYLRVGGIEGGARADVVAAHALLGAGRVVQARERFAATLQRACERELLSVQVRCLTGLGLVAQAEGDTAGAEASFEAAVSLSEDQRRALPGDEIRSAFLTDHLRAHCELLRIALDTHARMPTTAAAMHALTRLERFRARALGERLARPADPTASPVDDASRVLRARLDWLYRRVRRLDEAGEPSAELAVEMRRTERELLERARRGRLDAGDVSGRVDDDDAFDVGELQPLLGAGDALVAYGVLDSELFAFVVLANEIVLHRRVADIGEAVEAARAARFQIETFRHGAGRFAAHLGLLTARAQARMAALHGLLWAPIAASLATSRRVVVVAAAELGSVPFAALHDGERPLAERHALAFAPSARIARHGLLRRPTAPKHALVLGESSRLPHAAHEALHVASLFDEARVGIDGEATTAFLQAHAAGADVIHLACHAQFRTDSPAFSALHLHDAALTAEWAETLSLQPGLVVLSGCETGLADAGAGDEMVGLVRAFLVAGTARVVASLWPVEDDVTALFMSHFYRALFRAETVSEALRGAQQAVMLQHPHPFHWAAFAVHGGW